jgi:hypothetical protein
MVDQICKTNAIYVYAYLVITFIFYYVWTLI